MRTESELVRRARGYGLVEVAISAFLVCVALSLTLVAVGAMVRERRSLEHRQRGAQEVQNALERFLRLPWKERTAAKAGSIVLDSAAEKRLPGAKLRITVTDEAGPPVGRKVLVELIWATQSGEVAAEAPVKVVAWTYPSGSDES